MITRTRWYVKRTDDQGILWYYQGSDTWSLHFYDRYFWYRHEPVNHPIFLIYTGCQVVAEPYTLSRFEESITRH